MSKPARIGFISTRFSGTDGVSLEAAKWEQVLESQGHTCTFFAGACEWPPDVSYVVPEAYFEHPDVHQLSDDLFDDFLRSPQPTGKVNRIRRYLKLHLDRFVNQDDLQVLIVENALALPMHVPLALAITEQVAERGLPTIAHHHDFTWERSRYTVSAADDYLRAAFPPLLHSIRHVVINSYARQQLALRTGASATVIPNVMDFASPPPDADALSQTLSRSLAIPSKFT